MQPYADWLKQLSSCDSVIGPTFQRQVDLCKSACRRLYWDTLNFYGSYNLLTNVISSDIGCAVGSFYNKISDPDMGGAYLTLLNTIANMGRCS